jgi:alpha-tubulin suppressor-like RCC1 family protein
MSISFPFLNDICFLLYFRREEMQADARSDSVHFREDATGHMLCWGSGEFGQHGHGYKKEVSFLDGAVERFCAARDHQVKHVGCGSSHTAVVTSESIYSKN